MSSEVEALWREFEAETDDNIEALERLLTGRGAWSRDDIGALFRAFHSLKGTFGAMGMPNVEAVAHNAEDLLSLVRDGRVALDTELAALLLFAVDRLKDMRDAVLSRRADPPPARELIAALEQHRATLAPGPPAMPAAAQAQTGLDGDAEMIGIFSELLLERSPAIAGIVSGDAGKREEARQAAAELATGAEVLGFEGLAGHLNALAAAPEDALRPALIERLNELRSQIAVIEEIAGTPAGAHQLAAALTDGLGPDYVESLMALAQALASDREGEGAPQGALVAEIVRVRALANCMNLAGADAALVLLEEQYRRAASGELTGSQRLREIAQEILAALAQAADRGEDMSAQALDTLSGRWRAAIDAGPATAGVQGDGGGGAAPTGDFVALRPEFRATLPPEQVMRVEQAIRSGKHAFEILIDLENDPVTAAGIVTWLASAVETVTSRTIFGGGGNRFEFLVLSGESVDWIRAQLANLDFERACVHGVHEIGASGAATVEPRAPEPAASGFMRVRSDAIDDLMAEVGEMRTILAALSEVLRNGEGVKAIPALRRLVETATAEAGAELHNGIDAVDRDLQTLLSLEGRLGTAYRRIWEDGLKLRVVPVEALFTRLTRAARDLAHRLHKQVDVIVEGRDVRIDKSIVDLLVDPLMHMVRNALDHGIEPADQRAAAGKPARARLTLTAAERGNRVRMTVADDGRGLDKARILAKAIELGLVAPDTANRMSDAEICRLILRPGFSTAEVVTELSGRGVGMDVVESTLQRLGGAIDVETTPGHSTRFVLTIPISAALVRCLLVQVENQVFAIPDRQIAAVAEIGQADIDTVGEGRFYGYKNTAVPLHPLGRLLGLSEAEKAERYLPLVIATTGTEHIGLLVDQILRFQDLFLKDLHPMLAMIPVIGGASVLGDGRPVLVLDAYGLVSFAGTGEETWLRSPAPPS
jgi:two-component system, chemotaxis family, sensor kinase CheA